MVQFGIFSFMYLNPILFLTSHSSVYHGFSSVLVRGVSVDRFAYASSLHTPEKGRKKPHKPPKYWATQEPVLPKR